MSTTVSIWRVDLAGRALRGAAVALGLLVVALLTATGANAQTADLAVTQVSPFSPVTVTNNGPSAAANVALVNIFPPNTEIVDIGPTPAGWQCGISARTTECKIPILAAGATATFQPKYVSYSATPSGTVLIDDAIITSNTVDPNPANNLASLAMTISSGGGAAQTVDLAVTKTGPATVAPGQNIPYTIVLTNNGPLEATFVALGEATPPDTTFVSLVAPTGWNCDHPVVGGVGQVRCGVATLAVGATATFTLTVQALTGTPSGTTTTNVVTVVPNELDPTLTNNRVTLNTLIQNPTATPTATVTGTPTATSTPTATPTGTTARIPGDFNGDGFVDIRDYGVWRQQFGASNCGNPADADGNCLVDIRDYGVWRLHFGEGTPPAAHPGTPAQAAVRPLLGAPPVAGVRLLSLAPHPVPADASAASSSAADPWPRQALEHSGRWRPWAFAAALGIMVPREIMLRLAEGIQ
jgi:uncharacterized repeat protein (TIGR01451 family)